MGNIQELEQDKKFETFTADTLSSTLLHLTNVHLNYKTSVFCQAINYAIDKKKALEDLFNHIGKEATRMYQSVCLMQDTKITPISGR